MIRLSETSTKVGFGVLLFQTLSLFFPDISNEVITVGTAVLGIVDVFRQEDENRQESN